MHDRNLVHFHNITFNVPPQQCLQQNFSGEDTNLSNSSVESICSTTELPFDLEDFIPDELLDILTPIQESCNNILLAASCLTSFQMFVNEQNNSLKGFVSLYHIPHQGTKCNWCAMVSHLDTYLNSTGYKDQCTKALQ